MIRRILSRLKRAAGDAREASLGTAEKFHSELIRKTNNFGDVAWLGNPIWQNVLDLWIIQEVIAAVKPVLLLETGTNRGGSSLFYAHLLDLMNIPGEIVTVDVEKLHDLSHQRITYLLGDSAGEEVASHMRQRVAAAKGPVMVILDSDHSEGHVARELDVYAPFVTPGSYMLVQDGVIDVLPMLTEGRPGPLPAIEKFLSRHPEYELDEAKCKRFLLTHHPKGWLRRRPG